MNLYVQLTDEEYEQFKKFKQKPRLEDNEVSDLASALLTAIKRDGGSVTTDESLNTFGPSGRSVTTAARINKGNFTISLIVGRT